MWYTYVSPPATIDYGDVGGLDTEELLLTNSMIGIDVQLGQLERVMSNADKPPTAEWISNLFSRFPWLDGFAGVKADGTILGQEPSTPMKPLDFSPLLEEDKKQNLRALRGHIQDTSMGPEVFLAAPLFDAQDFLGVVVTYFDIRNLLTYSTDPTELIVTSPQGVLWQGKYSYESTPLASVDWEKELRSNTKGTVSRDGVRFYWVVRYLGNQPLIFAVSADKNATATVAEEGADKASEKAADSEAAKESGLRRGPIAGSSSGGMVFGTPSNEILPGNPDSVLVPNRPSPFGPKPKDIEEKEL